MIGDGNGCIIKHLDPTNMLGRNQLTITEQGMGMQINHK